MAAAEVEVAIVGAGLSGLAAALRLVEQGMRSIVLLDAQDCPGGSHRTLLARRTDTGEDVRFDAGSSYAGPTQHRLLRLLERFSLSVPLTAAPDREHVTVVREGQTIAHQGFWPPPGISTLSIFSFCSLVEAVQTMEKLAGTVPRRGRRRPRGERAKGSAAPEPPKRPADALPPEPLEDQAEADEVSAAEWIARTAATETSGRILGAWVRGATGAAPAEVSMLWVLRSAARAGSVC